MGNSPVLGLDKKQDLKTTAVVKRDRRKGNSLRLSTKPLHIMMIPAVIILFIYHYVPMFGVVIAFQDFDIMKGIRAFWESEWIGLAHYRRLFSNIDAGRAFFNTLNIAIQKIVVMNLFPLGVTLLLNEIRKSYVKRTIQTVIYLPHFLSWVILAGILRDVLATDGVINSILNQVFGLDPIFFLGDKNIFPQLIVWSHVWKEFGFSTIVTLAAITGIDPALYEAAIVDGASRLRQTWHITLPGLRPVIVLGLVLSLGGILNAGFEQVFNLISAPVLETGDIIDTLVYRISITGGQYDLGTAVGLMKSGVSFFLITISYWLAYKIANYEIF